MQPPYLFISHSSQDDDHTAYLAEKLSTAGYRCWVDVESIPDGSSWPRMIQEGVENCSALVVVMTPNARASEWVEREILLAQQLRKPVFVAMFEDVTLPIYLINRQFSDFRKRRETGVKRLLAALKQAPLAEPAPDATVRERRRLSPNPNEHNFFKYMEQLPDGAENARVAKEIFGWASELADNMTFSGRTIPAFHAHVWVGPGGVVIFSLRCFPKQPAVEVPLQYLTEFPPYDQSETRLRALAVLNSLLPVDAQLDPSRADRRPTVPLTALSRQAAMAHFRALIERIAEELKRGA